MIFLVGSILALIAISLYEVQQSNTAEISKKTKGWSIGVYFGSTPFDVYSPENLKNPVLKYSDITDVPARFVADPFGVKENSTWHLFFEVFNTNTNHGDIGHAVSIDGTNWIYDKIILNEPFHLAYPYVFKHNGDYYMTPSIGEGNDVRLYKSVDFPYSWYFVGTLLKGNYDDPSVVQFEGMWFLFVESNPKGNDILKLYFAEELLGPWIEHPQSPIVSGDPNIARPGGRVLVFNETVYRFAQDDFPTYGNQLRAFQIENLSKTSYFEKEVKESPILTASGNGWNEIGMHHIDLHQIGDMEWIAFVDGKK